MHPVVLVFLVPLWLYYWCMYVPGRWFLRAFCGVKMIFTITVNEPLQDHFDRANLLLQQHAGGIKGDLDKGSFWGHAGPNTVEGDYQMIDRSTGQAIYQITITHKPLLVPLDEVEKAIRAYFQGT